MIYSKALWMVRYYKYFKTRNNRIKFEMFIQIYHSKKQLVSIIILSRIRNITGASRTNQTFETTRKSHNGVDDEYLMDAH